MLYTISTLFSLIAIIVAIIVPTLIYIQTKKKKKLICLLFPPFSLVNVGTEVKDRIKIFCKRYEWEDKEELVKILSVVKVKIKNDGNLPIQKEDIFKPLVFNFGKYERLIDYSLINTEPKGITVAIERNTEDDLINCSFDLLNPSDNFTLQFLFLGETIRMPEIDARIRGLKHVDVLQLQYGVRKTRKIELYGNGWNKF
jgi:hypothetical protein